MLKVKDIMTQKLQVLHEEDPLFTSRFTMKLSRVRHIPIVDKENYFVGLITHRDLLAVAISPFDQQPSREQALCEERVKVKQVMKKNIMTIHPEDDLLKAIQLLVSHKYGCLPVVDFQNKLVGLVTEADFMKFTKDLLEKESKDFSLVKETKWSSLFTNLKKMKWKLVFRDFINLFKK